MSPLSVDRASSRDRSAYLAMIPQLEQQGFLRLPADPVLRQAVDRAFAQASEFFARPAEEKFRHSHPEWVEGYRELGPEYSQVPERPDLTESFSTWNHNRVHAELEAWRDGCPLHGALRDAADLLADVVRDLFAAMRDHFAPGAPDVRFFGATYTQLNHYEPARHSRELLQDPHEDGHLVTLVTSNAPGLELEIGGAFVPANVTPDHFVVMPGSLLSLMTGYRVKPGYHQVRNSRRTDPRLSMMFFVNPEIDQQLAPWIENESNKGIDIIARANAAPKQFGYPSLEDILSGHADTRPVSPHVANAAQ
jgi:isopenicillin N synthase-like dioxygenase